MGAIAQQVDGRRLRREQNREAVIDALVDLFEEGSYTPSSSEIAERAGISPRSLFRYFDDVDDLNRAAIERHISTHRALFDAGVDPAGATQTKIRAFVEARVRLHETVAPGARAARLTAHRHDVVAQQLRETRTYLRRQVATVFAPELQARPDLLPAVDVLCSFESYDFMRAGHSMSRAKATAALVAALTSLLNPGGTP
jgi:AcrR family transcriptional regulator